MYLQVKIASAKLVVFDFDQTVTVRHVFHHLRNDVRGKNAASELGQIRLIDDLNDSDEYPEYRSEGGFAKWAVGGEKRLTQLRGYFSALRDRGVRLVICSFGLVATVRKVLGQLKLLEFFEEVYGKQYKGTAYDQRMLERGPTADEEQLLAAPEQCNWRGKSEVICKLREKLHLSKSEVIFIDDDIKMLKDAEGECWTIWVKGSAGMLQEHLDEIDWRTKPSRLPGPLLSCFEPLAVLHLSWRTHLQLKEEREMRQ